MRNLFLILLLFNSIFIYSQSVGISSSGSTPDPSAMLDVKSTTQGILIPRMSTAEKNAISNPINGLLVYDNDKKSFYFYSNSQWNDISINAKLLQDADNDTKVNVELSNDDDMIRFQIAGQEKVRIMKNVNGVPRIELQGYNTLIGDDAGRDLAPSGSTTGNKNTFLGYQSGQKTNAGYNNIGIGYQSLLKNLGGDLNIAMGAETLEDNLSGNSNIAIGNRAVANSTTSSKNVGIGQGALSSSSVGSNNVAIGISAGTAYQGSNSVIIGYDAGNNSNLGDGNILIGAHAGTNNLILGSNKLYIQNVSDKDPLIYGEFDNELVKINGTLKINEYSLPNAFANLGSVMLGKGSNEMIFSPYGFPSLNGTINQILKLNASGNFVWQDDNYIDGDANSTNEIQSLSLISDELSISSSNNVDLSNYSQSLALSNYNLSISNNNSVDLSSISQWSDTGSNIYFNSGKVGIGVTNPNDFLEVYGTTSNIVSFNSDDLIANSKLLKLAIGPGSSNTAQLIECKRGSNEVFKVNGNGQTTIGSGQIATGFMLSVDGKVACEEVNVEMSADWPDYVFKEQYKLRTLVELEKYINKENHLPGIPTAKSIKSNGIILGEMQASLLEKIEELTLYLIELNKRNKSLEEKVNELLKKNKK